MLHVTKRTSDSACVLSLLVFPSFLHHLPCLPAPLPPFFLYFSLSLSYFLNHEFKHYFYLILAWQLIQYIGLLWEPVID